MNLIGKINCNFKKKIKLVIFYKIIRILELNQEIFELKE